MIQSQKIRRKKNSRKPLSLLYFIVICITISHSKSSSPAPPGPDSLYADPNTIEHPTTATGEEYAMVDVKGRKKKQTQKAALYQVVMPSVSTSFLVVGITHS